MSILEQSTKYIVLRADIKLVRQLFKSTIIGFKSSDLEQCIKVKQFIHDVEQFPTFMPNITFCIYKNIIMIMSGCSSLRHFLHYAAHHEQSTVIIKIYFNSTIKSIWNEYLSNFSTIYDKYQNSVLNTAANKIFHLMTTYSKHIEDYYVTNGQTVPEKSIHNIVFGLYADGFINTVISTFKTFITNRKLLFIPCRKSDMINYLYEAFINLNKYLAQVPGVVHKQFKEFPSKYTQYTKKQYKEYIMQWSEQFNFHYIRFDIQDLIRIMFEQNLFVDCNGNVLLAY
jgi:hypothetical protein